MVENLFVYGSLRRGGSAAWMMDGASRIPATLDGHDLYGVTAPYPTVAPGDGVVAGELVTVPSLGPLDDYEGPDYRREVVEVRTENGSVSAWVYLAADHVELDPAEIVTGGDWFRR